jgi:hypothetical protein
MGLWEYNVGFWKCTDLHFPFWKYNVGSYTYNAGSCKYDVGSWNYNVSPCKYNIFFQSSVQHPHMSRELRTDP